MIGFRSGTSLLNKVVKQFDQAIVDLDIAQKQIAAERAKVIATSANLTEKHFDIEDKLEELAAKFHRWVVNRHVAKEQKLSRLSADLYAAQKRAETVGRNIAKLVGVA